LRRVGAGLIPLEVDALGTDAENEAVGVPGSERGGRFGAGGCSEGAGVPGAGIAADVEVEAETPNPFRTEAEVSILSGEGASFSPVVAPTDVKSCGKDGFAGWGAAGGAIDGGEVEGNPLEMAMGADGMSENGSVEEDVPCDGTKLKVDEVRGWPNMGPLVEGGSADV
jgi:hypothetical protein